jgi:hypothetical protein
MIDDEVVLVPALEWYDLRADGGYHQVEPEKAIWMLRGLSDYRLQYARGFLAEARLQYFDLSRLSDREVLDTIVGAIRCRRVVAIQKGTASSHGKATSVNLRYLVEQIDQRGSLSFQGRQYKLVVADDLPGLQARDRYAVVSQSEACAVLDGLAKEFPASAEIFRQASERISKDWRPSSSSPEGLALLRWIPIQASKPKDDGPAITPSQLQASIKAKEEGWIKVEVVDDFDEPWNADTEITLTDGSKRSYNFAGAGVLSLENIEPGTVTVDLAWRRSQPPG